MPPVSEDRRCWRARQEDIPDLIDHFVRQRSERLHLPLPRLPVRELDRARDYDWPGNIRELQNAVERAVILARGGALELPLPAGAPLAAASRESLPDLDEIIPEHRWHDLERANVICALRQSEFGLYGARGAAERLGVNPATLASRLKRPGISATDLKRSQHAQQGKA